MCQSHDKKTIIYGNDCNIWILYDEKIKSSFQTGHTPFVICFNEKSYKTYIITGSGLLKMKKVNVFEDKFLDGNTWSIYKDSLRIGNTIVHINNVSEDTIFLQTNAMLINIKNKFFLKNCTCNSLNAQFKGGNIDSIKTLLNYKE